MTFSIMNLGILEGIFSWALNIINEVFAAIFIALINLFNLIFGAIMFSVAAVLGALADFFQGVFRSLAGLGVTYVDGSPVTYQDPIFTLITSNVIWKSFLVMIAVAFVLVIIMSIVAIIRNEYNTEKANNTKGGILGTAVKSIAFFAVTPVVTVIGVMGCNTLLRILDRATGSKDVAISGQVFSASAYGANRIRLMEDSNASNNSVSDAIGTVANALVDAMNMIFSPINIAGDEKYKEPLYSMQGDLYDTSWSLEEIAAAIDNGFALSKTIDIDAYAAVDAHAVANGLTSVLLGGQTSMIANLISGAIGGVDGNASFTQLSWTNAPMVAIYYQLSSINYIVLLGGMAMVLYIMYTSAFGLIMRLYKCTMLFLVSAPIIAMGPLDNHKAFGNWKTQFIKQALGAYGVVLALNLAFKIISVTNNINLFDPSTVTGRSGNSLIHALMSIVALFMMKDFIKMISDFVGGDDVYSGGSDMAKKATKAGLAVGAVALTGGAVAATKMGLQGAIGTRTGSLGGKLGNAIKTSKVGQSVGKKFSTVKNKVSSISNAGKNLLYGESAQEKGLLKRQSLLNLASTGFSALKGGMDNAGLGQFTKFIGGGPAGKMLGNMKNNTSSELAKIDTIEKMVAQKNNRKKQYIGADDELSDEMVEQDNRVQTAQARKNKMQEIFQNINSKGEYVKGQDQFKKDMEDLGFNYENPTHFKNAYQKEASKQNQDIEHVKQTVKQEYKDTHILNPNEVMKAMFNIDDATIQNMNSTERTEKLNAAKQYLEMDDKTFEKSITDALKADGKGGLEVNPAAMAGALGMAIGAKDANISTESINQLASAISSSVRESMDASTEKIAKSLKGEEKTQSLLEQMLGELKGMKSSMNNANQDTKNKK